MLDRLFNRTIYVPALLEGEELTDPTQNPKTPRFFIRPPIETIDEDEIIEVPGIEEEFSVVTEL